MSSEMSEIVEQGPGPERPAPPEPRHALRWGLLVGGGAVTLAVTGLVVLACLGVSYASWAVPESGMAAGADDASAATIAGLESKLVALRPREPYVVIDTYNNRLRVHRQDELLRDAVCSTGSGVVLLDPRGERSWTFDSPLGERRVQRKVKDPVWAKPDWAFIEEGYLPPKDPNLRFDDFSLGDYALYLGDGYIIHGTIFQTLLGRPVTHGCVRLGDEDLEYVYRTVRIGARVYLY